MCVLADILEMSDPLLRLARDVHELLTKRGLSLAVAESCTGGLISSRITDLPGASRFFEAGIVTYSAKTKERFLGIPKETLHSHGVVSSETAREMAERVRSLAGTDYALSVTGNLGPEVLEDKERGLVFIAVSGRKRTVVSELRLKGQRAENKEAAAAQALHRLLIEIAADEE